MLKNYIAIALRNLIRSPLFSVINILGMVLGITCSALILLFAWDEYHHDSFHSNIQNIYRITTKQENAEVLGGVTPGPLAPELKNNFPEIVRTARLGKWSGVFKNGKNLFSEEAMFFADADFIKIFDFPLLKGNAATVLKKPTDLLITEDMALKYFGNNWQTRSDIIGAIFNLNNEFDFTVAGILKNPPINSSLQFNFLLSFEHILKNDKWGYQWGSYNYNTFVELAPSHNITDFNKKIKGKLREHDQQAGFDISTQPLSDIYLYPMAYDTWTKQGNTRTIQIFVIIGIGILIIACFNFINLSTAQSAKRAKEVGIRKTIGASRTQIFIQFLGESLLVVFISVLLARGVMDIALHYFNSLIGKELILPSASTFAFILLIVFIVSVGFLASLYPASLLSSFQAAKVLKGIHSKAAGQNFRKVLVVLQFSIAFILLVGTIIIYQQLSFMQQKDLGFDKEQLLYVRLNGDLKIKEELFREELAKQAEVIGAAGTTSILVNTENLSNMEWAGKTSEKEFSITQINTDPFLIPLMGMKMMYGRNFSPSLPGDSTSFIINETAAKNMGLPDDQAIGREITFWGAKGKIIGVMRDFHFRPLYASIQPLIMRYQSSNFYFSMLVKVKANQVVKLLDKLPALYKKYDKENPISYGFVDEQLNKSYQNEQQTGAVLFNLCVLSIFITSLGLLGLAAYSTEQRTKEMGIRKVMGASVTNLVALISKEFSWLIISGFVISFPFAWWFMNSFLAQFAYHIDFPWWVFLVACIFALTISLMVVSSQVLKVALANPTKSLRSE